jgi:hypothetical protein
MSVMEHNITTAYDNSGDAIISLPTAAWLPRSSDQPARSLSFRRTATIESPSGRRDLNPRPLVPQTNALTKLRHVPILVRLLVRTHEKPTAASGAPTRNGLARGSAPLNHVLPRSGCAGRGHGRADRHRTSVPERQDQRHAGADGEPAGIPQHDVEAKRAQRQRPVGRHRYWRATIRGLAALPACRTNTTRLEAGDRAESSVSGPSRLVMVR